MFGMLSVLCSLWPSLMRGFPIFLFPLDVFTINCISGSNMKRTFSGNIRTPQKLKRMRLCYLLSKNVMKTKTEYLPRRGSHIQRRRKAEMYKKRWASYRHYRRSMDRIEHPPRYGKESVLEQWIKFWTCSIDNCTTYGTFMNYLCPENFFICKTRILLFILEDFFYVCEMTLLTVKCFVSVRQ